MDAVPYDPRENSEVPRLGTLPKVCQIGEDVIRVLAPNASPMTLDGTNTYLVMDVVAGAALIVDPGPLDAAHLAQVRSVMKASRVEPVGICLTHHHLDHSEAASKWAEELRIGVSAKRSDLVIGEGANIDNGDTIKVGAKKVRAISTPGHVSDHLSFETSSGMLLTGDHILGRSTSVIAYPDGNLEQYLESLIKTRTLGRRVLLPGHGPTVSEELSGEVIDYYIAHRNYRMSQVLAELKGNSASAQEVTRAIYGSEVAPALFAAALSSTLAGIEYLKSSGKVVVTKGGLFKLA